MTVHEVHILGLQLSVKFTQNMTDTLHIYKRQYNNKLTKTGHYDNCVN